MSTLHSRLRAQNPFLTPQFSEDDELRGQSPSRQEGVPSSRVSLGDSTKILSGVPPIEQMRQRSVEQPLTRPRYSGVPLDNSTEANKQWSILDAARAAPPNAQIQVADDRVGWDAPKSHSGVWDRLRSIGTGALINTGEYARQRPGAETAELLTAGATGGVIGGVSPLTIDAQRRQMQIGNAEEQLTNQLGVEGRKEQLEALKARPVLEAEKARVEQERQAKQIEMEERKIADQNRRHRETLDERKTRSRPRPQPDVLEDPEGNKYLADPDTGEALRDAKGNIRYSSRARDNQSGIQGSVESVKTQLGKVDEALQSTAEFIPRTNEYGESVGQQVNPRYTDLKNEQQSLQKELRDRQEKLKPAAPNSAIEQKIREAAKAKGLDPDKAIEKYRSGKY